MHQHSFAELVAKYEDPGRAEWQKPEAVVAKLGELTNKTVADIGAGSGYFSFRLADAGANVVAKDVDERFIHYLDSVNQGRPDSMKISVEKIPYDDPLLDSGSADIILLVNTYHHLENRLAYFKKVKTGLKESGKLYIVDFKKEESSFGPPPSLRLSSVEVSRELKKAGFSKILIDENTLPDQYILIAKKPMEAN